MNTIHIGLVVLPGVFDQHELLNPHFRPDRRKYLFGRRAIRRNRHVDDPPLLTQLRGYRKGCADNEHEIVMPHLRDGTSKLRVQDSTLLHTAPPSS